MCYLRHTSTLRENRHIHTIRQWVVKPQPLIQPTDTFNLVLGQLKTAHVQILRQTALVVTLWNDRDAPLRGPAQEHLGGSLVVLGGDVLDQRRVEEELGVFGFLHVELAEGLGAEGGVGCYLDATGGAEVEEILLDEVGVVFDLERLREVFGVALEVQEECPRVVAHAEGFDQAFVVEGFHGVVGFFQGGFGQREFVVFVEEARRVADAGVDVFEGDGEVDDVEVEVVDAPVLELLFADWLHAVFVVEAVPELADDEELFALDEAFIEGLLDALSAFGFVAVVAGAVEEPVAGLDGVVDLRGARVVVDFPKTEADQWHLDEGTYQSRESS